MTKQMKVAMAAMLMVGTLPMHAQEPLSTTTKTTKVAPGVTKTTVTTTETGAKKKHVVRRKGKKAPVESRTAMELRELRGKTGGTTGADRCVDGGEYGEG